MLSGSPDILGRPPFLSFLYEFSVMASGIISSALICMHLTYWALFMSLLLAITQALYWLCMRDEPLCSYCDLQIDSLLVEFEVIGVIYFWQGLVGLSLLSYHTIILHHLPLFTLSFYSPCSRNYIV